MRASIERARRRTRLHALADGLGLAPAEILFDHVRRGGCYAAVPRSAALLGLPDAAVAERAGAEGWCWREAQARASFSVAAVAAAAAASGESSSGLRLQPGRLGR
jgi:hypothetical protein